VSTPSQAAEPLPVELGREGRTRSRVAGLARTARREEVLFRIGVGLVALHVVDDSFLQPQPGTSAGDHLAGGLIPVGVLLAVAVLYSRLRPGLRAPLVMSAGSTPNPRSTSRGS
jgi:hypothetical protein